ncbi:hypothetical protein ASG39_11235 [Rhizobium sp. Leaf371]|uniref:helix-turn-helix transcriptional regulator n=1 Tax=Rhizobium sp. Leaf371 TaxID=1736355 RepID=UPI000712DE1D|nr:helix-turn-helix transcriptional regulator [Rhizobium sp. Leaf371]KQS64521.1 hypothetical protein ASG39_11235 [Rhizobium sp. Leaf371]
MTDWRQIIRDLSKEKKLSIRKLSIQSGVARSTIKRFLSKKAYPIRIDNFERLLVPLGRELDAFERDSSAPRLELTTPELEG